MVSNGDASREQRRVTTDSAIVSFVCLFVLRPALGRAAEDSCLWPGWTWLGGQRQAQCLSERGILFFFGGGGGGGGGGVVREQAFPGGDDGEQTTTPPSLLVLV